MMSHIEYIKDILKSLFSMSLDKKFTKGERENIGCGIGLIMEYLETLEGES